MAANRELLEIAFEKFDEANAQDPNTEVFDGNTYAKEVLYAIRMTKKLDEFEPLASTALKLTARCQHICRWEIPRDSYPMNRVGYLKWREELKKFHAKKASEILRSVGYPDEIIEQVAFLLEKKKLKRNEETQTLEDVICLVFLQFYFEEFSLKHDEPKIIDILQKTWKKMSSKGHQAAMEIPFSDTSLQLVKKALA